MREIIKSKKHNFGANDFIQSSVGILNIELEISFKFSKQRGQGFSRIKNYKKLKTVFTPKVISFDRPSL